MTGKMCVKRVDKKPKPAEALRRVEPLNIPKDGSLMLSKRQCPAMSKRTGEQCKNYCSLGMRTCRFHGSGTKRAKISAAKTVASWLGWSAEFVAEVMADPSVPLKLRVQIAQDLMTRGGINGKQEVEVNVNGMAPWEAQLAELFVVYSEDDKPTARRDLGVIDAVVVEDEEDDSDREEIERDERERMRRKRLGYSGAPTTPPTRRVPGATTRPPGQQRTVIGPEISGPYDE